MNLKWKPGLQRKVTGVVKWRTNTGVNAGCYHGAALCISNRQSIIVIPLPTAIHCPYPENHTKWTSNTWIISKIHNTCKSKSVTKKKLFSDIVIHFFNGRKYPILIYNSYAFTLERRSTKKSVWVCKETKKTKCKVRIHTMGNSIFVRSVEHNHEENFNGNYTDCTHQTVNLNFVTF